ALRAALSAHELGHMWGAVHCNESPCVGSCRGIMDPSFSGSLTSFDSCSIDTITTTMGAVNCLDATTTFPAMAIESVCIDAPGSCANDPMTIIPEHNIYLKGFAVTGATSVTISGWQTISGGPLHLSYNPEYLYFAVSLPPALGEFDV